MVAHPPRGRGVLAVCDDGFSIQDVIGIIRSAEMRIWGCGSMIMFFVLYMPFLLHALIKSCRISIMYISQQFIIARQTKKM